MKPLFRDRVDAGRQLAARLSGIGGDVVVLGLPRGGVPVAAQISRALSLPLDVIVVRKLGLPYHPELAMGAIGEDGVRVLNDNVIAATNISGADIAAVEVRERTTLERRVRQYRRGRARTSLAGRTALIVDDGIATGATAAAACQVARALGAQRVVVAAPVASRQAVRLLSDVADAVVYLAAPESFSSVGQWYGDFSATTDDEVVALLDGGAADEEVAIDVAHTRLSGALAVPYPARGIVVFAHGSGSGRHSPRNRYVAGVLNDAGLATLLFDLLTPEEEADRSNVFDIDLLGGRLAAVTWWLREQPSTTSLPVGYFGASTGAGAALVAAAALGDSVRAVVSRGGRPDLAGQHLAVVRAPTLLIVGSRDTQVLELNRWAAARLRCENRVAIVPGATHLFEEPGTLLHAAELARGWFVRHLEDVPGRRAG